MQGQSLPRTAFDARDGQAISHANQGVDVGGPSDWRAIQPDSDPAKIDYGGALADGSETSGCL
jgi:hypothetical protein